MKQYQETQLAIESTLSTIVSIIEQNNDGFELRQNDVKYIQECLKRIASAAIIDMRNKMSDINYDILNISTEQCDNYGKR